VAFYIHKHSEIDETNILQVVKAVAGETLTILFFCTILTVIFVWIISYLHLFVCMTSSPATTLSQKQFGKYFSAEIFSASMGMLPVLF
jgi:hypothetical protein